MTDESSDWMRLNITNTSKIDVFTGSLHPNITDTIEIQGHVFLGPFRRCLHPNITDTSKKRERSLRGAVRRVRRRRTQKGHAATGCTVESHVIML